MGQNLRRPSKGCEPAIVEFANRYNETWLPVRISYPIAGANRSMLDQNATTDPKLAA